MITDAATVAGWVKTYLVNDPLLVQAWQSADSYISERVDYPTVDDAGQPLPAPAALVEAVCLLAARYLARRNSPDGMVGVSDLGPARVPTIDRDVERLIDPWRFFPVA